MRLLIVGLDGATFDVISRLFESGKLRTIYRLVENGVSGTCKSTHPPVTSPAWPSFMTGCNPGKHGVFHFFDGSERLYTSQDIKKPAFWEILGKYGYRSLIMNVPVTYPPKKISGVLVTGMLTPPGASFAYPPSVEEVLRQMGYVVAPSRELLLSIAFSRKSLEKLIEIEQKRTDAFVKIASQDDFDLGCIIYQATDIIQHRAWKNANAVYKVYEAMDLEIKRLIDNINPDNIIIISDHGFGEYKMQVNINQFLFNEGLLSRKKGERNLHILKEEGKRESFIYSLISTVRRVTGSLRISQEDVVRLLPNVVVTMLRKYIPVKLRRELLKSSKYVIDRDNSKAYVLSGFEMGIWINKEKVDDYETFRDSLIEELKRLIDYQTGESVFEWVKPREEVYSGEYIYRAPDIIFQLKKNYYPSASFGKNVVEWNTLWGHDYNGIFIGYGSAFKKGKEIVASLNDIAPIVLTLYRVPIPKYMDGKPLFKALKDILTKTEQNGLHNLESKKIKSAISKIKKSGKI